MTVPRRIKPPRELSPASRTHDRHPVPKGVGSGRPRVRQGTSFTPGYARRTEYEIKKPHTIKIPVAAVYDARCGCRSPMCLGIRCFCWCFVLSRRPTYLAGCISLGTTSLAEFCSRRHRGLPPLRPPRAFSVLSHPMVPTRFLGYHTSSC